MKKSFTTKIFFIKAKCTWWSRRPRELANPGQTSLRYTRGSRWCEKGIRAEGSNRDEDSLRQYGHQPERATGGMWHQGRPTVFMDYVNQIRGSSYSWCLIKLVVNSSNCISFVNVILLKFVLISICCTPKWGFFAKYQYIFNVHQHDHLIIKWNEVSICMCYNTLSQIFRNIWEKSFLSFRINNELFIYTKV